MKQNSMVLVFSLLLNLFFSTSCNDASSREEYTLDYDIVTPYMDSDAWTAYGAFNKYLLDSVSNVYKLDVTTAAGANTKSTIGAIWTQSMYWDMAINAYKRAKKEGDTGNMNKFKSIVDRVYLGDSAHYVSFDWQNQDSNNGWFIYDDIMWWTGSFARAYGIFQDTKYLTLADESFCRVWYGSYKIGDKGSYDKANGGMFWQWNNSDPANDTGAAKMSCINFPTVIAAATLYNNISPSDVKHQKSDTIGFNNNPKYPRWFSRDAYLANAKEIYAWGAKNLFDASTGNVADSRTGNSVDWSATVYNQATFIGASCLLYKITGEQSYLNNALLATNYIINTMSLPYYILPVESGEEQGIYTAIFAQNMDLLINECGQTQFLKFIQRNINYGWSHRNSFSLVGKDYTEAASSNVSCYDASGIPSLMLLFPVVK